MRVAYSTSKNRDVATKPTKLEQANWAEKKLIWSNKILNFQALPWNYMFRKCYWYLILSLGKAHVCNQLLITKI